MQRLIKKIIILGIIILTILSVIVLFDYFVIGSQYEQKYTASLIDKVARLKSINEPKIILVGNSNVAFGIRSDKIEKELDMPVVNLGLHGGMGNAFHERIAKLNINKGDIVVVCHSNFSDEGVIENYSLAWITYEFHNELGDVFLENRKDYIGMLYSFPKYFRNSLFYWLTKKGNRDSGDCYSRAAFNEYGDVVFKPSINQEIVDGIFAETNLSVPSINNVCIDRLNELNKYCVNRGAVLVVAGYPIAYGEYSEYTKEDFIDFQRELEGKLDCEIISDYSDYFYPYSFFYDALLHLNEYGTDVRTNQLIEDLKEWMEQ